MNTRARIATVCQAQRSLSSVEASRAHVLELLNMAAGCHPDLICLPETCTSPYQGGTISQVAESVPGPSTDAVSRLARERRVNVILPLLTRRDGAILNSAVVIDRHGEIRGIYDKLQPVTSRHDYTLLEDGVAPGRQLPVFDLDFGRIGIQICFDAGFPDAWSQLAQQDVRLVVWCSAYNGGMSLRAYAMLHGYYVVSSVRTDRSRIIDPCGTVLASTDRLLSIVWRDINLDHLICHSDFNYSIPDRIQAAYGDRVEIRSHQDEGLFLIEPTDASLTIAQLQQEFGLESRKQYFARHQGAYRCARDGRPLAPQSAAHGDRPMYNKA